MMPAVSQWATSLYKGKETCITSKGRCVCRSDKCFNSTWVAVHGMESICVVTWCQDVDMTCVHPFYQSYWTNQQTMCSFATTLISEVECLPYDDKNYNDGDLRLRFGPIIEKPFGVVSVVPDTKKVHEDSGHEDSSYEYDVSKATMFLEEKMNSGMAFTIDETIQVTSMSFLDGRTEHLRLDQRKEHLAVINGGSSEVMMNMMISLA